MELETLAVDEVERYRGSFRFGADDGGQWSADVVVEIDGDEMGSAGCYGGGWSGHDRPLEGWDGRVLSVIGSGGMDVFDDAGDDEVMRPLLVVYGFAAGRVTALDVAGPGVATRSIEVTSDTGGFAVVLLGEGEWTIAPRLLDGSVGRPHVVHLS